MKLLGFAVMATVVAATSAHAAVKTGFYAIHNLDLSPTQGDQSYLSTFNNGIFVYGGTHTCFGTSIHLPHGATMTNVTAFYQGATNTATNVNFYLMKRQLNSQGESTNLSEGTGKNHSGNIVSLPMPQLAPVRINNKLESYGFAVCLNAAGNTFHGARITYTYSD